MRRERFQIGRDSPITPNYDFSSDMRNMKRTMVSDTYRDNPYKSGALRPRTIKPDIPIQPDRKYNTISFGGSMI